MKFTGNSRVQMSMVGSSDTSLRRAAVEFRPGTPLARSSSLRTASTMIVGIGFGVAAIGNFNVSQFWKFINFLKCINMF